MFKTSGGKYIAPQLLENDLKESILIEQVLVVGEAQKFPAALIVPSFVALRTWCQKHKLEYTSDAEMVLNDQVKSRIQKDVQKVNDRYGGWEQVKQIRLLPEAFTIEGGELTPTMKLKRKIIHAKYEHVIQSIYK